VVNVYFQTLYYAAGLLNQQKHFGQTGDVLPILTKGLVSVTFIKKKQS